VKLRLSGPAATPEPSVAEIVPVEPGVTPLRLPSDTPELLGVLP